MKAMNKIVRVYKIILILLSIGVSGAILWQYFAISGAWEVSYDFSHEPDLITELNPLGRVSERQENMKTGDTFQIISGEPVYFTVSAPRSFDSAEVTLTYNNPSQKIIELGLRKSADWIFDLKPLENKFIDDTNWYRLAKDDLILLQKQKDYTSIDDFTANLPKDKKIAFYNYIPRYNFSLDNYIANDQTLEINQSLRGRQEFYTYLGKNEDMDFSFSWDDGNKDTADSVMVKVYKVDTEIFDDGSKQPEDKKVFLTDLGGGLYKIILEATDDAVFSQIKTQQQYLVLKNKIYLASTNTADIYTNSDIILFYANNLNSIQDVDINNQAFGINKIETFLKWKDADNELGNIKKIQIKNADLLMQGYGYFSFTPESFFDPDYNFDNINTDTNIELYDYLLASNYNTPVQQSRWKTATQEFDLTGVPGDRKELEFTISAPGISEIKDNITIKEINVKFKREPLTLKNIWHKFIARIK